MSVREFKVETPSTSQGIRDRVSEIIRTGEGTLTLVGVEIGNELAGRRGNVRRTFELEILSFEPGGSFSIETQDVSRDPKQWMTVYETDNREVHIQVAE